MSVLDSPLYMSTLTVGRKFTEAICRRAVCCRAEGFGVRRRGRRGDGSNVNDDAYNDDDAADDLWRYKLNHPTLMETNVYMDETGKFRPHLLDTTELTFHLQEPIAFSVVDCISSWIFQGRMICRALHPRAEKRHSNRTSAGYGGRGRARTVWGMPPIASRTVL
jgi:hypothetical protein